MSRKFQVGDKARIVWPSSKRWHHREGIVRSIFPSYATAERDGAKVTLGELCYDLDIFPTQNDLGRPYGLPARYLERPYDGNQAASWSDCVWQPKSLVKA